LKIITAIGGDQHIEFGTAAQRGGYAAAAGKIDNPVVESKGIARTDKSNAGQFGVESLVIVVHPEAQHLGSIAVAATDRAIG
jgi:hypothetical protein